MKNKYILLAACCFALSVSAQKTIKSQVRSTDNQPVNGAIVSVVGDSISALSDDQGYFQIPNTGKALVNITADGYYPQQFPMTYMQKRSDQGNFVITLVPRSESDYNGYVVTPFRTENRTDKSAIDAGLESKDFSEKLNIGAAIGNDIAGLQVIEKSGIPGEGSYLNVRGIHSLTAENTPLIVINGVPYFSNQDVSLTINGYSRDLLFGYNPKDIKSVTVLKGADAAAYGSLGSNGVIVIETQQATRNNLRTRVSFSGQYGANFMNNTLPVMGSTDFKNYMADLGMTRYSSLSSLVEDYPFLQNSNNYYYNYLFNENTDWMKRIDRTGFVTDNTFRVEGGDQIAKYNISFGYTGNKGTLSNLGTDKYHTLISADVLVTRKFDIQANVSLSYITSDLQNFGMNVEYNPLLSAYHSMPVLSPYQKQPDGEYLQEYATYDGWNINSIPSYSYDNVSNPLALVNTVEGSDKIYDANTSLKLNFHWNDYLTLSGLVNLYYNYTEEAMFVPGVTDHAIMPKYYGYGQNYVAEGVIRQSTNTYQAKAEYNRVFGRIHDFGASLTGRFITHSLETDFSSGYNTANDYYKTLNATQDNKISTGTNLEWNYMSWLLHAHYTWNNILKASAQVSMDGSSASGTDATRLGFFPSGGITFMAANTGALPSWIDRLNFTAEGSLSGNSRFSPNYGKNYYVGKNLFSIGTIERSNVPNLKLTWEKNRQFDFGFDLAMLKNRINLGVNYYTNTAYDLLVNSNPSKVYGSTYYYDNTAEISGHGVEVSLRVNPIHTKDFDLVIGANISTVNNELKKLGDENQSIISFTDYNSDDAQVIMKVGQSPYEYYGYKTAGVFATTAEAEAANLTNRSGHAYQAGDVHFIDQNGDGVINDHDKVSLGTAQPDAFGAVNLMVRYRQFELSANFGYQIGGKNYNATRRQLESMDKFYNQSTAVLNRWQVEGQQTAMPRAAYGDPSGNAVFSDRWIEDADYFKMRSLKLTYNFNKLFNFVQSGSVFIAAENLFTITKYLGSDPEFMYSYNESMRGFDYAKLSLPVTAKIGFNLNF